MKALRRGALQLEPARLPRQFRNLVQDERREPTLSIEWHARLPFQVVVKPRERNAQERRQRIEGGRLASTQRSEQPRRAGPDRPETAVGAMCIVRHYTSFLHQWISALFDARSSRLGEGDARTPARCRSFGTSS
jgi:hypothetical protein